MARRPSGRPEGPSLGAGPPAGLAPHQSAPCEAGGGRSRRRPWAGGGALVPGAARRRKRPPSRFAVAHRPSPWSCGPRGRLGTTRLRSQLSFARPAARCQKTHLENSIGPVCTLGQTDKLAASSTDKSNRNSGFKTRERTAKPSFAPSTEAEPHGLGFHRPPAPKQQKPGRVRKPSCMPLANPPTTAPPTPRAPKRQ